MQGNNLPSKPDIHVKKDVALEALRGMAAFIVVAWHFLLAYAPGHVPILPDQPKTVSILGQPWFGLVYGTSSVTFFFVLSGFVLSRKALLRADPLILARGAVKRWPRLAAPVVIAVLFSWAMFVTHSYGYIEAGAITHSWWLSSFGTGIPQGSDFHPDLLKALKQGYKLTFLQGEASYDSSLWTMRIEFIGSFLVFGLAALIIALRGSKLLVRLWVVFVILMICNYTLPFTAPFAVGVALAMMLGEKQWQIPLYVGCGLMIFAVWLAGYYPGVGLNAWLTAHVHHTPPDIYVHTLGAVIAIFVIEATPALRKKLSGRISAILGKLSFPVYLLHVPVLCSAGAAVFLATNRILPGIEPKLAAGATTVIVTIILAWPLALFDSWWVRKLGAVTDRLVPRPVEKLSPEPVYTIH